MFVLDKLDACYEIISRWCVVYAVANEPADLTE